MVARYVPRKKNGGARSRAGRPKGIPNKATIGRTVAAAKSGLLPHEFALQLSKAKVGDKVSGHKVTWEDIKWAVVIAGPYFAPKYSNLIVSGPNQGPIKLQALPPEVLALLPTHELTVIEGVAKRLSTPGAMKLAGSNSSPGDAKAYAASLGQPRTTNGKGS